MVTGGGQPGLSSIGTSDTTGGGQPGLSSVGGSTLEPGWLWQADAVTDVVEVDGAEAKQPSQSSSNITGVISHHFLSGAHQQTPCDMSLWRPCAVQ